MTPAVVPPTLASLQRLADELPLLDFDPLPPQQTWLARREVRAYLDHYHINFRDEGLAASHHLGYFQAAGFDNAVHVWLPAQPRGTVFLVHGFTDSVGLMQHPIRFLLQQQWAVVAFDLPGHGLSSGTQASIDSFDQYRDVLSACLRRCRARLPRPWRGVGQSTGGAVWLNYLATYPVESEVDAVFLAAPLVRPCKWAGLRLLLPFYRRLAEKAPRRFRPNSHDPEFLDFIEHRDPLQPRATPLRWAASMDAWIRTFRQLPEQRRAVTIVQGDADDTVDFRYNLPLICEKFPASEVVMLTGARHQLFNESPEYRCELFAHLGRWLQRPAGALPDSHHLL